MNINTESQINFNSNFADNKKVAKTLTIIIKNVHSSGNTTRYSRPRDALNDKIKRPDTSHQGVIVDRDVKLHLPDVRREDQDALRLIRLLKVLAFSSAAHGGAIFDSKSCLLLS